MGKPLHVALYMGKYTDATRNARLLRDSLVPETQNPQPSTLTPHSSTLNPNP
jgi:hypothetical protein